ncbi:MAG: ECF transporter S component [Actinobacteria bacterium]|nr:ECF transporter S component [Actinomycetota bacterium]
MTTPSSSTALKNTNKWDTRTLVTMALFAAIGILLSFVEIPLFPPAPFLKFDPSFVTAMVGGFIFGPLAGVIIGWVQALVHGILAGNIWGAVVNCAIVLAYVVPTALIYRRKKTLATAIAGLVVGSILSIIVAVLMNLWITPIYMGVPFETVVAMIVPILLPFNLIKVTLNSVLTALIYKPISNLVKPAKERHKGAVIEEPAVSEPISESESTTSEK